MRFAPARVAVSSLFLLPLFTGCAGSSLQSIATSPAMAGNWKVIAAAAPASVAQVAALAGSLQVAGGSGAASSVTGVLHPIAVAGQSAAQLCVAASQGIAVSGSTAADGTLTLTRANVAGGGVLTVRGSYDSTAHTLANAQFGIRGGSCAVTLQPAVAQQYQPINGTYTGTFTASDGSSLAVSAQLTQTSSADANGNFTLSGTGTFASNPCVGSTVVSNSTVVGDSMTWTYTDANTGAQIQANGTFDSTASTLTLSSYTLTGGPAGCAGTGSGVLRK